MFRFIESIKINNGKIYNLVIHQERINATFKEFYPQFQPINIEDKIKVSQLPQKGLYKLRLLYSSRIICIGLKPYVLPNIKTIRLVEAADISYNFKYENREKLDSLYHKRGEAADILIVKNGLVTDSWFANVAFFKDDQWYTPKTPLLRGTQRELLLRGKKLRELDIYDSELGTFEKLALINAMIPLGDLQIHIENIIR